jgi:hypothetical protein
LENVPLVRERLRDFFASHPVTALVASAACGADLLALDEAATRAIPRRIVLPFEASRFRETSVADRPGDWGPLYDRALVECPDVVVLPSKEHGHEAYAAANAAILDEAAVFAGQLHDEVMALLVWNGVSNGESDLTQAFGDEARRRGFAVAEISTCDQR